MGKSPLALGPAQPSILEEAESRRLTLVPRAGFQPLQIRVMRGRKAVLARLKTFTELCQSTGQGGAARWLEFQMSTPTERKKIPTLVLVGLNAAGGPIDSAAGGLYGAAILYEYKIAGCGLRVFAGDDSTGQRAVIAPKQHRATIAEAACCGLVDQGALAAMLTYDADLEAGNRGNYCGEDCRNIHQIATRPRKIPLTLSLGSTFEETLAGLGRHTRRNLRYYRKRVELTMGAEFVPHATLSRDEFLQMNQVSANRVPTGIAQWRYDTYSHSEGMMFAGVRAQHGRWLSLIGGRRHDQVLEIDWQMNLGELPRLSLSTVMRSFLLEYETERGTQILVFNGGTPHSMRHSFASVNVMDALVVKRSPAARMLCAMAPWILPKTNFLVQALCDPDMKWASA